MTSSSVAQVYWIANPDKLARFHRDLTAAGRDGGQDGQRH
jgi:hypothetical protein